MTAEKHICCAICICQLTAILSGVSLLYLSVIVIQPSIQLLKLNFHLTPVMCTTLSSVDLASVKHGEEKQECDFPTCGEWCLSKGSGSCMQIQVMVRNNGSKVNFRNCVDILDENCSALDVEASRMYQCKEGACKDITGFFNCTKENQNDCRNITAAYICKDRNIDKEAIECTEEKCSFRLEGVFSCDAGMCRKLKSIHNYAEDCERKCTNLEMRERNLVLFSWERLVATACRSMDSPDNITSTSIENVSNMQEWQDKKQALMIFCSYVNKAKGTETYDILASDCFNATLHSTEDIQHIRDYLELLRLHRNQSPNSTNWVIPNEVSLRFMNDTQLRINPEGCVNTLRGECLDFFETHAHDGKDGMTADRYPCYYSDADLDYVIGKFDPYSTRMVLIIASTLPTCLLIIACSFLFFCSKAVGVDDEGHLKVTLLQSSSAGAAKEVTQFDELL